MRVAGFTQRVEELEEQVDIYRAQIQDDRKFAEGQVKQVCVCDPRAR